MIELKDLHKSYVIKGKEKVEALKGLTVTFPDKGMVFILGKSGSGKSTLLNVLGGLDTFDSGDLILFHKSSKDFSLPDFNAYRNKYVGFIFQDYNIISNFTVYENVSLAYELKYGIKSDGKEKINDILKKVGMYEFKDRKPNQLSGGQKQRVAIARALVKHPRIILADEPTGALDASNSKEIFNLLQELSKEVLVICVTHDGACAETYADRIVRLKDGRIIGDITRSSSKGKLVDGTKDIYEVGRGLLKVDNLNQMTYADLDAIKEIAKDNEVSSYITYSSQVRLPVDLIASDDSEDMPIGFKETAPEDIQKNINKNATKYNSKNGRIPLKRILEFAWSSLKAGYVRLIFTFLLSIISFTILGLSVELTVYDPSLTFADSIHYFNTKATPVAKQINNSDAMMSTDDFNLLKEEFPNAIPVYKLSNANFNKKNVATYDETSYLKPFSTSVATINSNEELENFGFSFLFGSAPKASDEVVLPDYFIRVFNAYGVTLTDSENKDITYPAGSLSDTSKYESLLKNKKVIISSSRSNPEKYTMKISGVIKTDLTDDDLKVLTNNTVRNDVKISRETIIFNYADANSNEYMNGLEMTLFVAPSFITQTSLSDLGSPSASDESLKNYPIYKVMVPTLNYEEMKDVYHFSDKTYPLTNEEKNLFADSENKVTTKSFIPRSYVAHEVSTKTTSISSITKYILWLSICLSVIASLITMNFIFTSVAFKRQEIGILKGLGSTSRDIFGIFVIEGLIIALANFVVSCALAAIITNSLNSLLMAVSVNLQIVNFGIIEVATIFFLSVVVSIISALIPSYSIANMKPVDAMKRGE